MKNLTIDRRHFLKSSIACCSLFGLTGNLTAQTRSPNILSTIRPPRLHQGDCIALTAPAGAIFNEESIQKATLAIESMGFRVRFGNTLHLKQGYLAGTDEQRANELHQLFEDKEVHAIVAMRGGWGCARLLHLLNWKKLGAHPKLFSGFSDITTLLLALQQHTGLVTLHGPVGNSTWEGFTTEQFLRLTTDPTPALLQQPDSEPLTILRGGIAEGHLYGGNLMVLCSLIGTAYLPDLKGALLFLEETEEEPYAIDRLLTQLSLAGILDQVAGIIFGKCNKCDAEEPEKSFTLEEVLQQKLSQLKVPVVTGFRFGHVRDKFTIPIGVRAQLDAEKGAIQLLESVVS